MDSELQDAIDVFETQRGAKMYPGERLIVDAARKALDIEQIIEDNWTNCEVQYHLNMDGVKAALGITETK